MKIWLLKNKQNILTVKNVYISSALGNILNIGHIAGELLSLLYTWEEKKRDNGYNNHPNNTTSWISTSKPLFKGKS